MNRVERAVGRVDRLQQRHTGPAFVFAVVKKFGDDRGTTLAALMTYYGFVSVFPLLLVLVTVLGIVLHGNPGLQHDLVSSALADFPVIGNQLHHNVHALHGSAPALVIGLVGTTWGSLGVAQAAQYAMAQVWNVPGRDRPGFGRRLTRAVLVLVVLAFAVVATTIVTSAATIVSVSIIVTVATVVATIIINIALYACAFRILTPGSVSTRALWPGAVVGGLLWTGLQSLGGWLVARQLRHTSELYGFFAVVLGLMAFLFLAAQLMVYAAEVNVVLARRLWPRSIVASPLTTADEQVLSDIATAEERRPGQQVIVEFNEPGGH